MPVLDKKMIEREGEDMLWSGLTWWLSGKQFTCQCSRCRFHPWVRKIPCRREWQPIWYSCLKNSMDRGAWWATVLRVAKELDTTKQLNSNNILWSGECMSYLKTFKALFRNKSWLGQTKYTRGWVSPVGLQLGTGDTDGTHPIFLWECCLGLS